MTWSAGSTVITPVVERAPTSAAPSVTAAQVSRPTGSATRFSFGTFGSCFRTSGNCASLVMTNTFFAGTNGSTRSTASCKKDFFPSNVSNCLGVFSRLTGQNRSPRPPAMMMTKRFFVSGLSFIGKLPVLFEIFYDGIVWKGGLQRLDERFAAKIEIFELACAVVGECKSVALIAKPDIHRVAAAGEPQPRAKIHDASLGTLPNIRVKIQQCVGKRVGFDGIQLYRSHSIPIFLYAI